MRARMSQDQFLLKWNNHQNNFVEVFNFLRNQDAFVDVTLACDGKSFSAHKVVLSACSPYFQSLFQTNPCKHPIVFLKDVKGQDMEALIEFIYKGEVSVSQTELGSLISTAENLKIKGLAEPDRPLEKAVKHHLASPTRAQAMSQTVTTPIQHTPMAMFHQSSPSPSAKRKRTDQYNSHPYSRDKDDKITLNSLNDHNHRELANAQSQVVLLPAQDPGGTATDLSSQTYANHPATIATSEGVLYSVAGAAIYVGATPSTATSRGELVREVYQTDPFTSDAEETIPGPSGIQTVSTTDTLVCHEQQNIKLEPSGQVTAEPWDGSNQSYDDGGTGSEGGGGSVGVATPTAPNLPPNTDSLSLTLHSDLTDAATLHDSTRLAAARALLHVLGAAATPPKGTTHINEGINKMGFTIPGRCKVCGDCIPRGEHRSHMASHTAHRPLHCSICGRGFHQTEDLKRHIRIHTGEKPYKCLMCGIAFRQRGHLSRHICKYHPAEDLSRSRMN